MVKREMYEIDPVFRCADGGAVSSECSRCGNDITLAYRSVLAADNTATELWIQNQGSEATTMQVRIVRWQQQDGFERYQPQQDVVASPPVVRIEKGKKQLIRLIKQSPVPAGVEQAYRIIVDEIPNLNRPVNRKWA